MNSTKPQRRDPNLDPRVVLVELYLGLERAGVRNRAEKARSMARMLVSFSAADATRWLAPFVSANPGREARNGGHFTGSRRADLRAQNGRSSAKRADPETDRRADLRAQNGRIDGRIDGLTRDKVSLLEPLPSSTTVPAEPTYSQVPSIAPQLTLVPAPKKPTKARPPYSPPPCPDELLGLIPVGDVTALRALATCFVAAFASAGPDKADRHLDSYMATLVKAAARRRTVLEAWDAFGKARAIRGGKPLFVGLAFRALDHLTFRAWNEPVSDDDGPEIPEGPNDPPWEISDLKPEDIPPWERPPFHPLYKPRPAELAL